MEYIIKAHYFTSRPGTDHMGQWFSIFGSCRHTNKIKSICRPIKCCQSRITDLICKKPIVNIFLGKKHHLGTNSIQKALNGQMKS